MGILHIISLHLQPTASFLKAQFVRKVYFWAYVRRRVDCHLFADENLSDMTQAWKGPCSSLNRRPNKAHCYDFSGSERCWRKYNTIRSCWNVMFVFLQRKYIVYFMKLTLSQMFIMLSNQWRSIWYDSWTRVRITVFLPHSPCNRSARRASNVVGSAEDNSPHASTKYSTKV